MLDNKCLIVDALMRSMLCMFTRCLYFDSPYACCRLIKYNTTRKNIKRYYTPKRLKRYIYL